MLFDRYVGIDTQDTVTLDQCHAEDRYGFVVIAVVSNVVETVLRVILDGLKTIPSI